ncbi:hypothetical protein C4K88_00180 [Arthrobacter pityocampae]|uniref:Uncharacterized protein n=1 Tax=Arthrobacter pityocampae TaxID=547334 RepID=A0A2S5J0Q4_9MICC|nr:hypothetical protein [Arthrobacter pityocampae]PPB50375.1 hypothetical protein C4K88_00180 [Arthrobacter pityocampae]
MSADPHSAAVSPRAWAEDALARERGRVQMFNATRPDGLDGWAIALEQYDLLVDVILTTIDAFAADDGTVALQVIVNEAQTRLGSHPAFPAGRLSNYVRYTKVDLEARGLVERIPRSSPQRVRRTPA